MSGQKLLVNSALSQLTVHPAETGQDLTTNSSEHLGLSIDCFGVLVHSTDLSAFHVSVTVWDEDGKSASIVQELSAQQSIDNVELDLYQTSLQVFGGISYCVSLEPLLNLPGIRKHLFPHCEKPVW